jgi:hypothetical protein
MSLTAFRFSSSKVSLIPAEGPSNWAGEGATTRLGDWVGVTVDRPGLPSDGMSLYGSRGVGDQSGEIEDGSLLFADTIRGKIPRLRTGAGVGFLAAGLGGIVGAESRGIVVRRRPAARLRKPNIPDVAGGFDRLGDGDTLEESANGLEGAVDGLLGMEASAAHAAR